MILVKFRLQGGDGASERLEYWVIDLSHDAEHKPQARQDMFSCRKTPIRYGNDGQSIIYDFTEILLALGAYWKPLHSQAGPFQSMCDDQVCGESEIKDHSIVSGKNARLLGHEANTSDEEAG